MNTIETLTTFLGWCTAINFGVLIVTAIVLVFMRGCVSKIHGKLFKLNDEALSRAYFQYLGQYKIAIIVLNFVPYISLKLMS